MTKQEYIEKTRILKVILNTLKKIIYDAGSRSRTAPLIVGIMMIIMFFIGRSEFLEYQLVSVVWIIVSFLILGASFGVKILDKYLDVVKAGLKYEKGK